MKSGIKLRGGTGSDDLEQSQRFGDDDLQATQGYGDNDDDGVERCLVRWANGQPTGVAVALPDGTTLDILALGRMNQEMRREPAVAGAEALTVTTLLLEDSTTDRPPQVSRLQAEIQLQDGVLTFITKGQSFSFINETPLHATSKKYKRSARLYHGDLLRLGGDIDGNPGGSFSEFIYCVEASELGERPPPSSSTPPASVAATSAPATSAASQLITAAGVTFDVSTKPKSRTVLPGSAGFIAATRDGHFDLHTQGNISYLQGTTGSWVQLHAGQQRRLHSDDRIKVENVEYTCRLPKPAMLELSTPRDSTPDPGTAISSTAAAAELSSLAVRQAELTAGIVKGKTGKERSAALRSLGAAHNAHVSVALAAVDGSEPEQAVRIAANQLSKVANDYDKKRRREGKAADSAAGKAQRRDDHTLPRIAIGRAPGGTKKRDRHGDSRNFNNRTIAP